MNDHKIVKDDREFVKNDEIVKNLNERSQRNMEQSEIDDKEKSIINQRNISTKFVNLCEFPLPEEVKIIPDKEGYVCNHQVFYY